MAEFKNQNRQGQYQPESAKREREPVSKAGKSAPEKSANEQRERDRASHADQSHEDNARGDRNPGNFQQDQKRGGDR